MPTTDAAQGPAYNADGWDAIEATGWDPDGGRPMATDLEQLTKAGYRPVEATRALLRKCPACT